MFACSTNWGGTPVQFWSSAEALAKCNQSSPDNLEEEEDDLHKLGEEHILPASPWDGEWCAWCPIRVSLTVSACEK